MRREAVFQLDLRGPEAGRGTGKPATMTGPEVRSHRVFLTRTSAVAVLPLTLSRLRRKLETAP